MNIGTLIATLKADTTQFNKGLSEAKSGMSSFTSKATAGLKGVQKGAALATGGIVAIGAASLDFGVTAGKYESVRDAFGGMTKGIIDDVDAFEKRVAEASRGTLDRFTILQGGTTALSLIGKEAFTDFGGQFTQMAKLTKKASRATGKDVTFLFDSLITGVSRESKQLVDNLGVTIDVTQAKKDYAAELGKTTAELTPVEEKTAVLNHTLALLEETYKDVEVSGGGFSGAMSALKATISDAKLEIGLELLPILNDLVRTITPFIKEHLPKLVDRIRGVVTWFKNLSPATQKLIGVAIVLAPILTVVSTVLLGILSILPAVSAGITILVGVLSGITAPILLAVAAVVALIAIGVLLYKNWDKIKAKATELWEASIKPIFDKIGSKLTELKDTFVDNFNKIKSIFEAIGRVMRWWWENVTKPILMLFEAVVRRVFHEVFEGIIKPILTKILGNIRDNWEIIKAITTAAWNFIKSKIQQPIATAVANVRENINTIKATLTRVWGEISAFFTGAAQSMEDKLTGPFKKAKETIEKIAEWIKEAARKIDPRYKESPSLVERVQAGVAEIEKAYGRLGSFNVTPVASVGATALTPSMAGPIININMAGANISSPDVAEEYAELIGDTIIKRFNRAKRAA